MQNAHCFFQKESSVPSVVLCFYFGSSLRMKRLISSGLNAEKLSWLPFRLKTVNLPDVFDWTPPNSTCKPFLLHMYTFRSFFCVCFLFEKLFRNNSWPLFFERSQGNKLLSAGNTGISGFVNSQSNCVFCQNGAYHNYNTVHLWHRGVNPLCLWYSY